MDSIEEVIEKKIVEVLTNNTKLKLIINQQINKNELDDSSIIAITILIYLLALIISYYSILLYQNINNNSKIYNNPSKKFLSFGSLSQSTPKETQKKRKRRMTTKSTVLDSNTNTSKNKRESKKRNIAEVGIADKENLDSL
jgi:hypothetical protein